MSEEQNHNCNQCGAVPGERHDGCDVARCRTTGMQFIQCGGEFHTFNGREYGEHDGPCQESIWDGEWPGTKECREYGLYTDADSIWGVTEDLNTLMVKGTWDPERERFIMPS